MNLEGANSQVTSGVQGWRLDDFSQLKGYLDATSDILGGHGLLAPLNPPL